MKKIMILAILLSGCLGRHIDDEEIEEPIEEEEIFEPEKVVYMHWACCTDLCKGKSPASVLKEVGTPYILCECKNGKVFRVTRLSSGRKKVSR